MKLRLQHVIGVWAVLLGACGDCGGGPGRIEQKKGDELSFESIPLKINKAEFVKQALALTQVDPAGTDIKKVCGDQITLSVPDIGEETIVERAKGNHALANCLIRTNRAAQSTALLEVRGEFIDDRLARTSFRLTPAAYDNIRKTIEGRFGKGATVTLTEQIIIEETKADYQIWQEAGEIWMLYKGETGTTLFVHQDLETSRTLPEPPKATKRGEPVSLEDLGIGKLDLNAPLPDLDLPDSGADDDGPEPDTADLTKKAPSGEPRAR